METNNHIQTVRLMDKRALRVYGSLSAIVYSMALAYCYFTNRMFETALVGGVMLGLTIMIGRVYISLSRITREIERETPFRHAA